MTASARRLVLLAAVASLLAGCHKTGDGADATSAPEMTLGATNAKVTVVEYASDTCLHCARFDAEVFPAFKAKYIDTGKVRYAFREFLTPPEPVAAAGFLVARCAGKDRYFQVVDAIFRAQGEMVSTGDPHGVLLRIARSAGLSDARFNACVQDAGALKALQDRVRRAEDVDHIQSTPSFIVDGKPLQPGEKTLAELDAAIQPLLK